MMKAQLFTNYLKLLTGILMLGSFNLLAQDEEEFVPVDTIMVMDPGMFTPAETGYWKAGVQKDLLPPGGGDGIPEFYNGCYDAYGDAEHNEDGIQHGWKYEDVIIFRGCEMVADDDVIKGTQPAENWPAVGNIIQVTKHKYALTDTATFGYIASPHFTNLKSITVKVGTDLSINNNRQIYMLIEASRDNGATWEYVDNDANAFIHQELSNQGGDIHTYSGDNSGEGFNAIKSLSQQTPIMLRFMPFPNIPKGDENEFGERLKFWEITIEAQTAPNTGGGGGEGPLAVQREVKANPFVVKNQAFVATQGKDLYVYTLSGVLLGSGRTVPVCEGGLYIVKTADGGASKVYLK